MQCSSEKDKGKAQKLSKLYSNIYQSRKSIQLYILLISVMRVGSDTFDDPIFQKGLEN